MGKNIERLGRRNEKNSIRDGKEKRLKHIEDSGKMGNNGGVLILTKQVVVIFCFLFFLRKTSGGVTALDFYLFISALEFF
jgi:hypothetical protein